MASFPTLTPEEVVRLLGMKGFVQDRVRGSHHMYHQPDMGRRVVVPMHRRDLPTDTLHEIFRQAGMSRQEVVAALGL